MSILNKLQSLYKLATLNAEEQKAFDAGKLDEGRLNEARTASFLLLNQARTNSVKIKFEVPKAKEPPASTEGRATSPGVDRGASPFQYGDSRDIFDFIRDFSGINENLRKERDRVAAEDVKRPQSRPWKKYVWGKYDSSFAEEFEGINATAAIPPLIESSFQNRCKICGQIYHVGDLVWWVRGAGCSHKACGYEGLGSGS